MYSSAWMRGGHIVEECLPYRDRSGEAERVVQELKNRCAARGKAKNPKDKVHNPLIAIPGSPGSGKSSFFAHFPESTAFQSFLGSRFPIVSTLTFNSGMDDGPDSLGARILYGAVRAMGLSENVQWCDFSKDIEAMSALDAVRLLRRIFGAARPVLVLVDELSKATKYDATAMAELGVLLNRDGDAHVVVSSLSPAYIAKLLYGSQRRISYVILAPLDASDLGQQECKAWAESFISPTTNPFKANLLRSAYLLASGHPRSLEQLVQAFTSKVDWGDVAPFVLDGSVPSLLHALALETSKAAPAIVTSLSMDALELVFSAKLIKVEASDTERAVLFRRLLESGAVFICRGQGSMFSPAITGASIVDVLASLPSQTKLGLRGQAAKVLFQDILETTIADWWERCVDLTMVCRSLDRDKLHRVFGVGEAVGLKRTEAPLTVRKATNDQDLKVANVNELVVPPPGHQGTTPVQGLLEPGSTTRQRLTSPNCQLSGFEPASLPA